VGINESARCNVVVNFVTKMRPRACPGDCTPVPYVEIPSKWSQHLPKQTLKALISVTCSADLNMFPLRDKKMTMSHVLEIIYWRRFQECNEGKTWKNSLLPKDFNIRKAVDTLIIWIPDTRSGNDGDALYSQTLSQLSAANLSIDNHSSIKTWLPHPSQYSCDEDVVKHQQPDLPPIMKTEQIIPTLGPYAVNDTNDNSSTDSLQSERYEPFPTSVTAPSRGTVSSTSMLRLVPGSSGSPYTPS